MSEVASLQGYICFASLLLMRGCLFIVRANVGEGGTRPLSKPPLPVRNDLSIPYRQIRRHLRCQIDWGMSSKSTNQHRIDIETTILCSCLAQIRAIADFFKISISNRYRIDHFRLRAGRPNSLVTSAAGGAYPPLGLPGRGAQHPD